MKIKFLFISLALAIAGSALIGYLTKQWVLGIIFCFVIAGINILRVAKSKSV